MAINPAIAFYYGNKHSVHYSKPEEKYYVVYEIEIEKDKLSKDEDELYYVAGISKDRIKKMNLAEAIEKVGTCRVNFNLDFKKYVRKKIKLPTTNNFEEDNEKGYELTNEMIKLKNKKTQEVLSEYLKELIDRYAYEWENIE